MESVPKIGKKIGRGLLHGRQSGGERSSTGQGVLVSSACEKRVRVCESVCVCACERDRERDESRELCGS